MYLNIKQVAQRLGVDTSTIWRWKKHGNFPDPVKFGPQTTRWRLADVEAWEQAAQWAAIFHRLAGLILRCAFSLRIKLANGGPRR